MTLVPKDDAAVDKLVGSSDRQPYYPGTTDAVGSAVGSALSGLRPDLGEEVQRNLEKELEEGGDFVTQAPSGATITRKNGVLMTRAPSGATVTVYPPDSHGRQKIVSVAPNGARTVTYGDASDRRNSAIDRAIEMKAVGVTPEYAASIRAAAPWLTNLDSDDIVGMKAVGVTPQYIRDLSRAFGKVDEDTITEARAVGLSGDYVRQMAAAGYRVIRVTWHQLVRAPEALLVQRILDCNRAHGTANRINDRACYRRRDGRENGDLSVFGVRFGRENDRVNQFLFSVEVRELDP